MKTIHGKKYVSMATVSRMATYLECLTHLEHQHMSTVSSHELAVLLGVTPEQVRQDFSTFGLVGKRGSGYDVVRLKTEIELVFGRGADQWKCCIVGAGSLGTALVSSHMVQKMGVQVCCCLRYGSTEDWDAYRTHPSVCRGGSERCHPT